MRKNLKKKEKNVPVFIYIFATSQKIQASLMASLKCELQIESKVGKVNQVSQNKISMFDN